MSKKTNTLLFILGATVFNILVTIISFVVLLFLYTRIPADRLPEGAFVWGSIVIFVGATVLSFIVYQSLLKLMIKKVDVNKYFDPIFKGKKRS
jgi:hypothetical protein